MLTRYDLLYLLASPALGPYLLYRRLKYGKYTESAAGMTGRHLPEGSRAAPYAAGSLWIHAVSVGEVAAARSVAPGLRELLPGLPLVVSTVTETGQASARQAFAQDTTTYFPADFSPNVRRFQAAYNPSVFVLMETELWPNFLTMAARRGTQCFMINAKLSERSFPRYRRFQGVLRPALDALGGLCAQTGTDAERFAQLGIPERRIRVTGNCKFDLPAQPLTPELRTERMREYGMPAGRRWIVIGSTHPTEEELMLRALDEIRREHPRVGMVLCPRHPERFGEVAQLARAGGRAVNQASNPDPALDAEVVVLDKMGRLAEAYGLGELAIVAGSFCKIGGHNLMEAAAHGIPVVFGPQMHSQREIYRLFREAGSGVQVVGADLAGAISRLLAGEGYAHQCNKSLEVIEKNRGSAQRAVETIGGWLGL